MPIEPKDMSLIRELVHRRAGIVLDDGKNYLIEARVTALARKLGLATVEALLVKLRNPMPGDPVRVVEAVVEAMTTNETSFFRDAAPFECVRQHVIPDLLVRRVAERRLNIWSAASSTGQEPYTLAITLREHFPQLASWTITFIASDLSQDVLAKAKAGRYSQMEMNRGMPAPLLAKYFRKDGDNYEASADLRRMIDFRQVNLLDAWPTMPKLDLIFCRNVLIYFNQGTKKKILSRFRGLMRPDGYLFLGAAETTLGIDEAFERGLQEKTGCYRLRPPSAAPAAGIIRTPAPVTPAKAA
jgi:chemotaxis protein methyltransferase CheR